MTEEEAEEYHAEQINWFAETEADMVLVPINPYSFQTGVNPIKISSKSTKLVLNSLTVYYFTLDD